jgi:hypothetical protein
MVEPGSLGRRLRSLVAVETALTVGTPVALVGMLYFVFLTGDLQSAVLTAGSLLLALLCALVPVGLAVVVLLHAGLHLRAWSRGGGGLPAAWTGWIRALWWSLETVVAAGFLAVVGVAVLTVALGLGFAGARPLPGGTLFVGPAIAVTATMPLVGVVGSRLLTGAVWQRL